MRIGDYEIIIKSNKPTTESTRDGKFLIIGTPGGNYKVVIINHNNEYRIATEILIDGVDPSNAYGGDGFVLLAEPNKQARWDGYRIDADNVREFLFTTEENKSVATLKEKKERIGFIDVIITKENREWAKINPPPSPSFALMGRMSTAEGNIVRSEVRLAKHEFEWGGPETKIEIHYDSI